MHGDWHWATVFHRCPSRLYGEGFASALGPPALDPRSPAFGTGAGRSPNSAVGAFAGGEAVLLDSMLVFGGVRFSLYYGPTPRRPAESTVGPPWVDVNSSTVLLSPTHSSRRPVSCAGGEKSRWNRRGTCAIGIQLGEQAWLRFWPASHQVSKLGFAFWLSPR